MSFHLSFRAIIGLVMSLCLCFGLSTKAIGQSLIVGIPSADTTPKGEVVLTHESQVGRQNSDLAWNSFNFVTYGLNEHTELSLDVLNLAAPEMTDLTVGVGFKTSKPFLRKSLPELNMKYTYGTLVPISLQGKGVGNWSYGHLSMVVPKLKTRLTGGVSFGTEELFGRNTVNAIVGVEQPIGKSGKWKLIADWYSGTSSLSALIPAVQYNINQSDVLILGVKIPNNEQSGKPAVIFELTKRLF